MFHMLYLLDPSMNSLTDCDSSSAGMHCSYGRTASTGCAYRKEAKTRQVYTVSRHGGSVYEQKQPEIAALEQLVNLLVRAWGPPAYTHRHFQSKSSSLV